MIEELAWDSNFFGYRIGKVEVNKVNSFDLKKLKKASFDLIYIFSKIKLPNEFDSLLVDEKITFQKITFEKTKNKKIKIFDKNIHSYLELLDLAFQSGHESRFLKDSFFGIDAFKKLYKKWVDNSFKSKNCKVLVYLYQNKIVGFVIYKKLDDLNIIELIAVDHQYRGKNIGKELINAVEFYTGPNQMLKVATQKVNIGACNFYKKNNFKKCKLSYIYHYAPNTI